MIKTDELSQMKYLRLLKYLQYCTAKGNVTT